MTPDVLEPDLELLRQEYVLIQAWKKTASYIRYHNWYSDTLELDWTTINLPYFLREITEYLESPDQWESHALRMVPAPKSQRWHVSPQSHKWEPKPGQGTDVTPLRPLAYVNLRDQVVATALMLCLANRVETKQGDPTCSVRKSECRKRVISYGNRLFCDTVGGELYHRWGSTKLYRSYFQDYQGFVARPSLVMDRITRESGKRMFVVKSDLSQFYDRVRPCHLMSSLQCIAQDSREQEFFNFANRVLDWRWHRHDSRDVESYSKLNKIEGFNRISLPQGLVSAGFFANVVLLEFDERVRSSIGTEIETGVILEDACRYVDDIQIVVTTDHDAETCKAEIISWLQSILDAKAYRLQLSGESKTTITESGDSEQPIVRQSQRMRRIQSGVSGGFDAVAGAEILDAVQGMIRLQDVLRHESIGGGWEFSPVPDVRGETVWRFAAGRFRTTYRSIRPLFEASGSVDQTDDEASNQIVESKRISAADTQEILDENAREFALTLISRWVEDPSNVRLLRIGFDIWPDVHVLRSVLELLRPLTEKGGRRGGPRRVAWYCLAEILRAGATETGLVEDDECLPRDLDICQYRDALRVEAVRLARLSASTIPWYLRQQALLFLAVFDAKSAPVVRVGRSMETKRYRQAILFLGEHAPSVATDEFAILSILSRRALTHAERSVELALRGLTRARKEGIAIRDPAFVRELGEADRHFFDDLSARVREDLCVSERDLDHDYRSLADIVLTEESSIPLRNELSILHFAAALLEKRQEWSDFEVITPGQVSLKLNYGDADIADVAGLRVVRSRAASQGSLYRPPDWCETDGRWRFQLGFLLRFILTRAPDFTNIVRPKYWKERVAAYRPAKSHWYQRIYGMFSGHQAFGDDWLPITGWMEQFLLALLRWPGCHSPKGFEWVDNGVAAAEKNIRMRVKYLQEKVGKATGALLLPMIIRRPTTDASIRTLRACVVQTVVPTTDDIDPSDLKLNKPGIRRKHRNHLSAALAAVKRMLYLRRTHMQDQGRLDWLILPELAVHPDDVVTHLVPFARAHKALILTGLTYEDLFPGRPLVNSALWIIPERSYGLQIRVRRQGKAHIAPNEQHFNVGGFRPCQWLIGFPWSECSEPMWLTASVCYDATDLELAADLRKESDVFVIPALNKDVKTFDQMALALHYHMFQLVVVVNNGKYGGSNAYWPSEDAHKRQIFHLHGQPQASIGFFEIDDISRFLKRGLRTQRGWKYPPAGRRGV